jgi:hypothetical protein
MRALILFILFSVFSGISAQHNFMSIGFGGSWPLNDFSEHTDLYRNGFALTGFEGDYSGAFFNISKFGIAGNVRYISNALYEAPALELLAGEFPDDFPASEPPVYNMGFWKFVNVLAGPAYTLPFYNFNIDFYALAGIIFNLAPEMGIYAESPAGFYHRKMDVRTVNFGFQGGLAFRYHITARTSFRIYADYLISQAKGEVTTTTNILNNNTSSTTAFSCPVAIFNAGIGIAYRLNQQDDNP